MGTVRPLTLADGPQLAEVHLSAFGHIGNTEAEVRKAYSPEHLSHVVQHRYAANSASSMVFEVDGKIIGFVLVACRPARLHGETVWIASTSHLAVTVEGRSSLAAIHLLRAVTDGPQDLTYADRSNEAGRKSLSAAGFTSFPSYSLRWAHMMKPGTSLSTRVAERTGLRLVERIGLAIDSVAPASMMKRFIDNLPDRPANISTRELTLDDVVESGSGFLSDFDMHPVFDDRDHVLHEWKLLHSIFTNKRIIKNALVSARGQILGWYIAAIDGDSSAEVLQFIAKPQAQRHGFVSMLHDLREQEVVSAEGELPPGLLHDANGLVSLFSTGMTATSVHSHDAAPLEAFERNRVWLSSLEGEALLNPVASVPR